MPLVFFLQKLDEVPSQQQNQVQNSKRKRFPKCCFFFFNKMRSNMKQNARTTKRKTNSRKETSCNWNGHVARFHNLVFVADKGSGHSSSAISEARSEREVAVSTRALNVAFATQMSVTECLPVSAQRVVHVQKWKDANSAVMWIWQSNSDKSRTLCISGRFVPSEKFTKKSLTRQCLAQNAVCLRQ